MYFILAISLIPVIVLLLFVYKKDKYQKEPFGLLMKAFGGGIMAALTVLFIGDLFDLLVFSNFGYPDFDNPILDTFYSAFCQAAVPEECCKFLFLYLVIWHDRHFDEYYDGIEYAVFVSLGFAGLENILYVMRGGLDVAISRALFAIPAHCFFGILMGYFLSFAKFQRRHRGRYFFQCLFWPILIHGTYDFILMYSGVLNEIDTTQASIVSLIFYIFFFLVWRNAMKKVNRMSGW